MSVQACKKEEAAGSIFDLRHSIRQIYDDLQRRQRSEQPPLAAAAHSSRTARLEDSAVLYGDALDASLDEVPPPPPVALPPVAQEAAPPTRRPPSADDSASITPPPQAPYPSASSGSLGLRPASAASQPSRLASPAALPPTRRPSPPLAAADPPGRSSFAAMFDTDDEAPGDAADQLSALPPPRATDADPSANWADGSQSLTVLRHAAVAPASPPTSPRAADDAPQCNQSLSDLSPARLRRSADDASAVAEVVAASPFAATERRLSRIEDFLHGDLASFSASVDAADVPAAAAATPPSSLHLPPDDTRERSLDDVIRDTAAPLVTPASPARSVYAAIDAATTAPAGLALSPTKPPPLSSALSPMPGGSAAPAARAAGLSVVSESLRADLLASAAGEDFLQYAQRAYLAMRDRAVEQADFGLDASLAASRAASRPATAAVEPPQRQPPVATTPAAPQPIAAAPATPAGAGAGAGAATPKTLQSVRSANHENFDEFFGGADAPAADRSADGDSEGDSDEGDEPVEVVHHATAAALDDLLDDLGIHTPGGRLSVSVASGASADRRPAGSPPTVQTTFDDDGGGGDVDGDDDEALGSEAPTPVVLPLQSGALAAAARPAAGDGTAAETSRPATARLSRPADAAPLVDGGLPPRPATTALVLMHTLLERMQRQRLELEQRHALAAQERNRRRLRLGQRALQQLQRDALDEEAALQRALDGQRWPPQQPTPRAVSPKPPVDRSESVAEALGWPSSSAAAVRRERPAPSPRPSRLPQPATQPPVAAPVVAPVSSAAPVPATELRTVAAAPSPTQLASATHKPPPVAWQVDLADGGDGAAAQRPRSRPRAWSANRSRPGAAAPAAEAAPPASPLPQAADHGAGADVSAALALRPRSQSAQRGRVGVAGGGKDASSSKLSNFVQTKNAITHVCLAGGHQEERRLEVLDLLDFYAQGRQSATLPLLQGDFLVAEDMRGRIAQFVLMFYKAKTLAFKGVYVLDPKSKQLVRVFGKGPARINSEGEVADLAKEFLKFETSSKSFKSLPVKSLTSTVDAIILEPPKARGPPL